MMFHSIFQTIVYSSNAHFSVCNIYTHTCTHTHTYIYVYINQPIYLQYKLLDSSTLMRGGTWSVLSNRNKLKNKIKLKIN